MNQKENLTLNFDNSLKIRQILTHYSQELKKSPILIDDLFFKLTEVVRYKKFNRPTEQKPQLFHPGLHESYFIFEQWNSVESKPDNSSEYDATIIGAIGIKKLNDSAWQVGLFQSRINDNFYPEKNYQFSPQKEFHRNNLKVSEFKTELEAQQMLLKVVKKELL